MLFRSATMFIFLGFTGMACCGSLVGQNESYSSPQQRRAVLETRANSLLETVKRSAAQCERSLNQNDRSERRDKLIAGLGWEQFQLQLAHPRPDIYLLRAFSKRLYEPNEGLNLQDAIRLRVAIEQYTDVMRVLSYPDLESEIQNRRLAIENLLKSAGRLDTVRLGEHLDWLETAGVTINVDAVRRQYDRPNITLDVPKTFATEQIRQFSQEVDQTQYVTNVVLGTPISGYARTNGTAAAMLLPDNNLAGFRVDLQGVISAPNNVAVQDPVVVYSSGQSTFSASTSVVWDGTQFEMGETSAVCQTTAEITGIAVTREPLLLPGRLVNRVIRRAAGRRAAQQRPLGEAAASRLAESRLVDSLSEQVSESVEKLNSHFQDFVTRPLRQVGMLPSIAAVINPAAIRVSLLRYGGGRLAGTQTPAWEVRENEFALYLHESALTNFFRASAGGAVWTDRKFADLQKALMGDNSYELRIGLHPRWQTTLHWARPLATRFNDDFIVIQLNAERLKIDDTEYPFPFTVEASYVFETIPPSLGFARVGEVKFEWTGADRPESTDEAMLSGFIRKKFSGLLLDHIYLDGLRAPSGGGLWGKLGSFNANDAASKDGWVVVTFAAENASSE